MSLIRQSDRHKKMVQAAIGGPGDQKAQQTSGIVSWINGIIHGVAHFLQTPLGKFAESVAVLVSPLLRLIVGVGWAFSRIVAWIESTVEARIMTILVKWYNRLRGLILFYWQQSVKEDLFLFAIARKNTLALMVAERRARTRAIAQAKAELTARIRHLHQTIEREAASGYQLAYPARQDLITRLADLIAANNPVVRGLVSDLVTGVLDLAGVDSFAGRLLLGFITRKIIDRLGVDQLAGHFLDDLLAPILGNPKPRDLHGVIADIAARLNATESQWAQFYGDGGSLVEQAGSQWQALTGPLADAALVAWFAQGVAFPGAWAAEIADTVGAAADAIALAAASLINGE